MEVKKCSKCGEVKALGEFHKWKKGKDGHFYMCKKCKSEYSKIAYWRNREKETARSAARRSPESPCRENYLRWLRAYNKTPKRKSDKRAYFRRQVASLSDSYIKKQLMRWDENIHKEDISLEMIEIKRAQLKHLRMIKELKTIINET